MISETKEHLKVNGIDFECEPLGKFCLHCILLILLTTRIDNKNGDCLQKWSRYGEGGGGQLC